MSMFTRRCLLLGSLLFPCAAGLAHAEDTHTVKTTPVPAAVGTPATVSVTIESKNGWHLNAEAPISLKVSPPAGVTVTKPKLARADLAESTQTRARFDVSAQLAEPGPKAMAAEASFVVCQESACKPVKENVTLSLVPPGAAPKAKDAPQKAKAKRKA
ncbi:MAG: hypothetical protein SF187_14335 [Deltaproteobacteria bacterium]|nr:hypothetical protein [Deltaproteobacteria bacterium]